MNPAYRQVRFKAGLPAAQLPASFAIITAWNPEGETASPEFNQKANERLRLRLEADHLPYFPVTGGSLDFTHAEPGFGVRDIACDDAITLGREFRQEAIFWVEGGVVYLVSCNNPIPEEIGSWRTLAL